MALYDAINKRQPGAVRNIVQARALRSRSLRACIPVLLDGKCDMIMKDEEAKAIELEIVSEESWSPVLYAVLVRADIAIDELLDTYRVQEGTSAKVFRVTREALHSSIEWGNLKVFEKLLEHRTRISGHGVDLSSAFDINSADSDGRTLLMDVCRHRGVTAGRLVRRLLQDEPNVDAGDNDGNTALHMAAQRGSTTVVKALLNNFASSLSNKAGLTPLHVAFGMCNMRIAAMLVVLGHAEIDNEDDAGRTPLAYAFHMRDFVAHRLAQMSKAGSRISARKASRGDAQMGPFEAAMGDMSTPEKCKALITKIDELVEYAIAQGASCRRLDSENQPAFPVTSQLRWYGHKYEQLLEVATRRPVNGYDDEMFQDVRNQIAIDTVWMQRMRCRKLIMLGLWLVAMAITLYISVDESGRDSLYMSAFREQIDLAFLEENWGTAGYEQVFDDVQSEGDMYDWLAIALRQAVYGDQDSPRPFRNGDQLLHSYSSGGSVHGHNFFLGRPRLRTVRSDPCTDGQLVLTPDLDKSPLHNATCFIYDSAGDHSEKTFHTGQQEWVYAAEDVPDYSAYAERYDGDGFSKLLPETPAEYDTFITELRNHDFVDMNTRLVIVECSIYNPSKNAFGVMRFAFEYPTVGGISVSHDIQVVKLINYVRPDDFFRMGCEILLVAMFALYLVMECGSFRARMPTSKEHRKFFRTIQCCWCKRGKTSDLVSSDGYFKAYRWVFKVVWKDSGIIMNPWFSDVFNQMDCILLMLFMILIALHLTHSIISGSIEWSAATNSDLFVNIYNLSLVTEAKVYMWGTIWVLACLKCLDFLRVNRSLSTFILVIQGMFAKIVSFLVVFATVLAAFTGFLYVSFGLHDAGQPTLLLTLMDTLTAALSGVDILQFLNNPRFWLGPVVSLSMAIVLSLVMVNLLIAIMSEAYEELRDRADAIWSFTQLSMMISEGESEPDLEAAKAARRKRDLELMSRPLRAVRKLSQDRVVPVDHSPPPGDLHVKFDDTA